MKQKRKSNQAPILWITSDWDTFDFDTDTTPRLVQVAWEMGIPQVWALGKTIRLEDQRVVVTGTEVLNAADTEALRFGKPKIYEPREFRQIHYRTDPPINHAYLHPLQLLGLGLEKHRKTELVNPFSILYSTNEKQEASALQDAAPPTLITSQWEHFEHFGRKQGRTILKPLDECNSIGIYMLDWRTPSGRKEARERLRHATSNFSSPALIQRYLEGIQDGETRLWFLDGKLLAWIRKLPLKGDFKVSVDLGSRLVPTELTSVQKKMAQRIGKHLRDKKVRLAAVDLVEGLITDFNYTSPGLIKHMERVLGENLAQPIMEKLRSSTF